VTPAHDEQGYTLVELLLAVVIMGAIMGSLTGALVIGLRTTSTSSLRLSQTGDIELIQGVLPRDVLSATGVMLNAAANATCSGEKSLLVMTWSTPSLAATTGAGPPTTTTASYEVDYFYEVDSATPPTGRLTRKYFQVASPSHCTPLASDVIASSLSSSTPPVATVDAPNKRVTLTVTDSSGNTYAASAKERS
jgi:prepilin-type N-terminal cleavage/methylation domain-containing protein